MQFLSQARQERQGEMSTAGRWTAGAPPVQKDGIGTRHRREAAAQPLTAGHQCTPMRIGVTWETALDRPHAGFIPASYRLHGGGRPRRAHASWNRIGKGCAALQTC